MLIREKFEDMPLKSRIGLGVAGAVVAGAGIFVGANALDSDDTGANRLEIPQEDLDVACGADSLSPEAYLEAIGLGPYRTNEAYDEEAEDRNAIVAEVIDDISGNTMGIALLSEAIKQQDSDYTVDQFLGRVVDTYEELEANDDRRQETCESVVASLQTATLEEIKAPTLLEVTNRYEDEVLTGVQGTEVSSQANHPVVTVKDENGAVRFGIALQEDRDGKFLLILNNGETTGNAGEDVDEGTTATTIAEVGGGISTEQTDQGGGPSGSDGGGETSGGAPGGNGPGCDGVGTGCEGEGPGGPGGPGDGPENPTTTTPPTTTPPTTTPPTTTPPTTTPPTTTPPTTTPPTTTPPTTTPPTKPPIECDPVIDVC